MGGNLEIGLSRKTLLMSHAVCANPTSASRKGRRLLPSTVRRQSITRQRVPKLEPGIIFKPLHSKMLNSGSRGGEEKARDAELIYLHHIEAHGIPPHVASCTTLLFKQMFPDSKIAEKFTFSDSKQGYEITHGLGQHYNTRLVNRLQQEYFSINVDESTVLKTNQLAITVRYFHRGVKRVVTEHYKTVEIGKKDADSLVSVLHETFTADGIDYKSQLLHIETDSCPAMRGVRGGVITKMKTKVEYLYVGD